LRSTSLTGDYGTCSVLTTEASQLFTRLRFKILELLWNLNLIRVVSLLDHELVDPRVSLIVFVFLNVRDHLIEPLRFKIIFRFCHIQVFGVSLELLIIVTHLGRVHSGLTFEVVTLLSDKVGDVDIIWGLVAFDILTVSFLLIIMHEFVGFFDLLVVALVVFVLLHVSFFLHAS
jgi:hypothetical protein